MLLWTLDTEIGGLLVTYGWGAHVLFGGKEGTLQRFGGLPKDPSLKPLIEFTT